MVLIRWICWSVLICCIALAAPASGQGQGRRVALVIGNGAYSGEAALPNPVRDAGLVAEGFRAIGFEVTLLRDLDNRGLRSALQEFERKADGAAMAAIYFAGHGIAADGRNWLLPVDARLTSARHLDDEAVPHQRLLTAVEGANGLQLVILDACRNNPFVTRFAQRGGRSAATRGLEPITERELPPQRLVAFSARDGQVAQDGPPGGFGPYAQALRRRIAEPGVEIGMLFRRVKDDVARATSNNQEPWVYNNLGGDEIILASLPRPSDPAVPPATITPASLELAFWRSIEASQNPAEFEAYLTQFPQGLFAPLARNRLAALQKPAAPSVAIAPAPVALPQVPPPPPRPTTPPVEAKPLSGEEIATAQRLLGSIGFDTGGVTGTVNERSRWAASAFIWSEGMPRDTGFTTPLLTRLQQTAGAFNRLTERPDRSIRGTAARAVADAAARYARGWAAERASPPDVAEAMYWYGLAARQGNEKAMLQLGLLLARGQGIAADPAGAGLLWRIAAALGDTTATFNLGAMYERGIGTTPDRREALRWYSVAAGSGHAQARDAVKRVGQ